MVPIAALGREAATLGERFEQRRLAAAVLAHDEGHAGTKREVDAAREGSDIEGVARRVPQLRQAPDLTQKR
jgi:hypothetical protein